MTKKLFSRPYGQCPLHEETFVFKLPDALLLQNLLRETLLSPENLPLEKL